MSPWGTERPPRRAEVRGLGEEGARRLAQVYLGVVTVALVLLCAFALLLQRYEVVELGTVPTRLDRLTGELIGCIPGRGCFAIIPPGEPPLTTVVATPGPGAPAPQAQPPAAAPQPTGKSTPANAAAPTKSDASPRHGR